ncbi:MAG: HIT domain-containing protein [Candidatus Omnitrophota bacterium]|nr:HIT domain-containing protein [Candidatus Omnitrophota bacterium]
MNRIWAPWRIGYVTKKKNRGCVFCSAHKAKNDEKNFIVLRSHHCFVMLNTFPYNNGHIMVISNRHVSSLDKLVDTEILDINKTLIRMTAILKAILKPAGFNVGINLGKVSGAGIDRHLHIHLVPRWLGDTNFMPVFTDTKIISQSLEELYGLIKKDLLL